MFPLTRVPFWYWFFEPQPHGSSQKASVNGAKSSKGVRSGASMLAWGRVDKGWFTHSLSSWTLNFLGGPFGGKQQAWTLFGPSTWGSEFVVCLLIFEHSYGLINLMDDKGVFPTVFPPKTE